MLCPNLMTMQKHEKTCRCQKLLLLKGQQNTRCGFKYAITEKNENNKSDIYQAAMEIFR